LVELPTALTKLYAIDDNKSLTRHQQTAQIMAVYDSLPTPQARALLEAFSTMEEYRIPILVWEGWSYQANQNLEDIDTLQAIEDNKFLTAAQVNEEIKALLLGSTRRLRNLVTAKANQPIFINFDVQWF
ncbi:hypothetical protein PENTCL1PPCAC_8104, partial [Pristionchus entomophagus]